MGAGLQWKKASIPDERVQKDIEKGKGFELQLVQTLRQLEEELRQNESRFDLTSEADLLEACIYERQALQCRYRYYHTMARRLGIQCRESQMAQRVC